MRSDIDSLKCAVRRRTGFSVKKKFVQGAHGGTTKQQQGARCPDAAPPAREKLIANVPDAVSQKVSNAIIIKGNIFLEISCICFSSVTSPTKRVGLVTKLKQTHDT